MSHSFGSQFVPSLLSSSDFFDCHTDLPLKTQLSSNATGTYHQIIVIRRVTWVRDTINIALYRQPINFERLEDKKIFPIISSHCYLGILNGQKITHLITENYESMNIDTLSMSEFSFLTEKHYYLRILDSSQGIIIYNTLTRVSYT